MLCGQYTIFTLKHMLCIMCCVLRVECCVLRVVYYVLYILCCAGQGQPAELCNWGAGVSEHTVQRRVVRGAGPQRVNNNKLVKMKPPQYILYTGDHISETKSGDICGSGPRFPILVTWTRVRCSNDDRTLVPVHWHGAEMGSIRAHNYIYLNVLISETCFAQQREQTFSDSASDFIVHSLEATLT